MRKKTLAGHIKRFEKLQFTMSLKHHDGKRREPFADKVKTITFKLDDDSYYRFVLYKNVNKIKLTNSEIIREIVKKFLSEHT